jgi:hypothetical protein
MANVFFSYSHADEMLRDQLETQLAMLKRQGIIDAWHDRRIGAGEEVHREISEHLEVAEIVLLLVSPDFLASNYCYEIEMSRALERQLAGECKVIPVILRACDWSDAPFSHLMAVPRDGKPVTQMPDRDQAFLEVVKAIKAAVGSGSQPAKGLTATSSAQISLGSAPRTSNLRIAKKFSDHEKDSFRVDAFEYMARFFENSLSELARRNAGINVRFRRVDSNRFHAAIYLNGDAVSKCTVFLGGMLSGIAFVPSETMASNSHNDLLTVEADEQSLYLKDHGYFYSGMERDRKLSMEGASEQYWTHLIEPLQRG